MMLINVKQWKQDQLFDSVVLMAQQNVAKVGTRLSHHDQDIQNVLLDGKFFSFLKNITIYTTWTGSLFLKNSLSMSLMKNRSLSILRDMPSHGTAGCRNGLLYRNMRRCRGRLHGKCAVVLPKGKKNLHQRPGRHAWKGVMEI